MTTFAYDRRNGKTGRPLGMLDVFSKLLETAVTAFARLTDTRSNAGQQQTQKAEMKRVKEAEAVRRMADREQRWSPGFASDLYAAADRHEMQNQG